MLATLNGLNATLCCPRCRSTLSWTEASARCENLDCGLSGENAFPLIDGQPVLVDFDESILDRQAVLASGARTLVRRASRLSLLVERFEASRNKVAERFAEEMIKRLPRNGRLLVIGGGTVGNGAEALYRTDQLQLVGADIYASANTQLVADAHQLPFVDGAFDGVWIQAVLEHVLDPGVVAAEIHRVLKPNGLVFADTPFMQQVHEGAYDFTRFSVSGHRWLFRRFDCIDAGATSGPGASALWSIKYLVRAVTGNDRLARASTWPFLWLRLVNGKSRRHQDGASGVYFFGTRSERKIGPSDIVRFYERKSDQSVAALNGGDMKGGSA